MKLNNDLNTKEYKKLILKLNKESSDKYRLILLWNWVRCDKLSFNDFEALLFYCS